jgi:hypothetical protein
MGCQIGCPVRAFAVLLAARSGFRYTEGIVGSGTVPPQERPVNCSLPSSVVARQHANQPLAEVAERQTR